jgi:hypothetical protein
LWRADGAGDRVPLRHWNKKENGGQEMKIKTLITIIILVLLVAIVLVFFLLVGTRWQMTTPVTIDVPVGDDMATQIKKGTTIYTTANVPAFVLNGTDAVTTDFSATVKVINVLDTRTIKVMTLSPTMFEQQSGNVGYLYLCTPLSEKARKLSDGTIVYGGNGYPQIITGQSYDVVGVLQHPWQDDPRAYIPTALQFKQNLADSIDTQMFIDAARSFAEQAEAAGGHHMTAEPVITVDSKYVQAGKMEVMMLMKTMTALNSGPVDDEPMIAGELQYLRDHSTTLSVAAKKAVEDDIAYWRGTIKSAMTGSSEGNYIVKVVADVDLAGNIDASTLQVFVDNAPVGSNFIPAAQYLKDMRSVWTTVAQGYASAASLASAADAKAP